MGVATLESSFIVDAGFEKWRERKQRALLARIDERAGKLADDIEKTSGPVADWPPLKLSSMQLSVKDYDPRGYDGVGDNLEFFTAASGIALARDESIPVEQSGRTRKADITDAASLNQLEGIKKLSAVFAARGQKLMIEAENTMLASPGEDNFIVADIRAYPAPAPHA